jgi:crotonobetainyl-CoA:carnitine CoA-transferase CaiB-like acyl-CoA transferase
MTAVPRDDKPAHASNPEAMLSGYRVLDLCDEKGLLCTKLMADLGADVIVIEPPEGASARFRGPFYQDQPDREQSLYFWYFHTNKQSVTLNLETPEGQTLFKSLVQTADVLVETFSPGELDRLGLDYGHLRALKPDLIMTSITNFGREGPYAHYKASDLIGLSMGGLTYLCGEPDGPPVPPGGEQGYHLAALNGAMATFIALWHREMTGQGQHIDVSMQAAVANTLETSHQTFDFNREIRTRAGHRRQAAAFILPCLDGFIAVLSTSRMGWPRLLEWLRDEGEGEAIADPRFTDDFYRFEHEEVVHQTLRDFFATRTKQAIYTEAQRRRLPLAPVNTAQDLADSPQLQARGFFVDVEHPELGTTVRYPGAPYGLSETPWRLRRRPPSLGEDNEAVYVQELGLSLDELSVLRARGIV